MDFTTADLCDANPGRFSLLSPDLRGFGGRARFSGPVTTVRAPEDNSLVKAALAEPGAGRVLVVDGGASRACALLGGNLAALADRNDWSGVVIWGCVRDVLEIAAVDLGVLALARCPCRSEKRGRGERDVPLELGGVGVRPGAWLYADEDGVLLSPRPLSCPVR